jgi:L-lysine 2,3-aminomutase
MSEDNVSENIQKRMEEEKRKAELKQEQLMAKSRQDAKDKKLARQQEKEVSEKPSVKPVERVEPTPVEEPQRVVDDGEKYVTKEKMRIILEQHINKSFELVEEQFKKQQEQLDKLNNFLKVQKDYLEKLT